MADDLYSKAKDSQETKSQPLVLFIRFLLLNGKSRRGQRMFVVCIFSVSEDTKSITP